MNINAIKLNTFSLNQQKNSQNISSLKKTNGLEQDMVSFGAFVVSPKSREIRNLHLKIAELLQSQKGVNVFPHQRLGTDIGLNSGDLKILEQKINSTLLKGKPCKMAIPSIESKAENMSVRELAEKVYGYRHSWGRN